MPTSFVASAFGLVNQGVIIGKNGALRLTVEYRSSQEESACEEVDPYKMKDAVISSVSLETTWSS